MPQSEPTTSLTHLGAARIMSHELYRDLCEATGDPQELVLLLERIEQLRAALVREIERQGRSKEMVFIEDILKCSFSRKERGHMPFKVLFCLVSAFLEQEPPRLLTLEEIAVETGYKESSLKGALDQLKMRFMNYHSGSELGRSHYTSRNGWAVIYEKRELKNGYRLIRGDQSKHYNGG